MNLRGEVALFIGSPPAQAAVAQPRVQIRPLDRDGDRIAARSSLQRSGEVAVESRFDFHTPVRKRNLQVRCQKRLQMKRSKTARQRDAERIWVVARALKDF